MRKMLVVDTTLTSKTRLSGGTKRTKDNETMMRKKEKGEECKR